MHGSRDPTCHPRGRLDRILRDKESAWALSRFGNLPPSRWSLVSIVLRRTISRPLANLRIGFLSTAYTSFRICQSSSQEPPGYLDILKVERSLNLARGSHIDSPCQEQYQAIATGPRTISSACILRLISYLKRHQAAPSPRHTGHPHCSSPLEIVLRHMQGHLQPGMLHLILRASQI